MGEVMGCQGFHGMLLGDRILGWIEIDLENIVVKNEDNKQPYHIHEQKVTSNI